MNDFHHLSLTGENAMQNKNAIPFKDIGQGPALVLIHDLPLTAEIWNEQVEPLQRAGFRVILPDFSQCREYTTIAEYSHSILRLLNRVGVRRFAACGMGMGGAILFDLVERHPERIAGACFISTRPVQDDVQERARRSELINQLMKNEGEIAREQLVSMLFAGRERQLPVDLVNSVRRMVNNYDRDALINGLKAMINRRDYTQLLTNLQLPTMVVGGEHDSICHPHHVGIMAGKLPRCLGSDKLDGGHLLSLELPQELSRRLVDFFRRIAPRRNQFKVEEPEELMPAT
jgi:pimeloyl-ACP methyl ester carboxylesterase